MANASLISCNFSLKSPKPRNPFSNLKARTPLTLSLTPRFSIFVELRARKASVFPLLRQKGRSQISRKAANSESPEEPVGSDDEMEEKSGNVGETSEWSDWATSAILFVLWAALLYYAFSLSPNQTPTRDNYFLRKLLNLKGDDGFRMNQVLVALWYIMGLWPLVYANLLLPTARSSKGKVVVWPFVVLSFFGGVYALLPYFVLWKPPPPPVGEDELNRWPLNILDSKITAGVSLAAGAGILVYAGLAGADDWKEFFQYFRESRFIHVTCIDFSLLSAFAPFWVYNDITARKWFDKGSWLVPFSSVPFIGPALYILLRPHLSASPESQASLTNDAK